MLAVYKSIIVMGTLRLGQIKNLLVSNSTGFGLWGEILFFKYSIVLIQVLVYRFSVGSHTAVT